MGCNGSTQANGTYATKTRQKGVPLEAEEIKKGNTTAAPAPVVLGWAPITVGEAFDTPYGKGVVEELKKGDNQMTYAVVKLSSGFVSVTDAQARQWKAKASALRVGDTFDTPYGKGTVEELKKGDGSEFVYAVVRLASGFVSVPEAVAGSWKAASRPAEETVIEVEAKPTEQPEQKVVEGAKKEEEPQTISPETMEAVPPVANPVDVVLDTEYISPSKVGEARCQPFASCYQCSL